GRRISVAGERAIIGIVGNARATSSGFSDYSQPLVTPPIIYIPAAQTTPGFLKLVHTWFSPSWVVRASGPSETVAAAIRQSMATVDPMLPIARLESMTDVQAAAFAAVRLMQSFLWGVAPTDPITFGAVIVTLLSVALIASVIPALRVLRLDPALTLRAE